MTLAQAVTTFEAQFTLDEALKIDIIVDIVSGGIRRKGAPLPALYANQDAAIYEWLEVAEETARDCGPRFRWIERPALRQYQITISDNPATYRVTDSRWCVESRIVFSH